jgi:hypothetical protein
MTHITCYTTNLLLNATIAPWLGPWLQGMNITAISASKGGKYKVFSIMPDNGKDRLLSTNAQNRLLFEQ